MKNIVVGSGIIGLSIANELRQRDPDSEILVIEKEQDVGKHASGRNSGVLHAGFYYSADSLKARFCREGNKKWHKFIEDNNLSINRCGKIVVAQNEKELEGIHTLFGRGEKNDVEIYLIDEKEARDLEPNVKTFEKALWSPNTSSVSPGECNLKLREKLEKSGVEFHFDCRVVGHNDNSIKTTNGSFSADHIYNCAGLYADKVAHLFGAGKEYTLLPFKGVYRKCIGDNPVNRHIYPVPNLANPFLGVHFTQTVKGESKIGPTAIPAFWREHYNGLSGFDIAEFAQVSLCELNLLIRNSFGFRSLALQEIVKYRASALERDAGNMLNKFMNKTKAMPAGIRAQLLNVKTRELIMDFVVERQSGVTHVLNAISPAWTCAFPFAEHVVSMENN